MNLLLNYNYSLYPYTAASYLEMAALKLKEIKLFHTDTIGERKPDLIINIMPFDDLVSAPGVPSCYWEIDCHLLQGCKNYYYDKVDRVYIAQKAFLDLYPKEKTSYLPLGCDPEKHCRRPSESRKWDIGFIGNDNYPLRHQLLEVLNTNFKLLWTNSPPGDPYARLLSQCDLTFNRSLDRDVNMRFFEAIASGRMLLTDYLPAQDEIAINGKHYISYSGARDLVKKVSYYLKNYDERERIALAGEKHIIENHTYKHRLLKILKDFNFNGIVKNNL